MEWQLPKVYWAKRLKDALKYLEVFPKDKDDPLWIKEVELCQKKINKLKETK